MISSPYQASWLAEECGKSKDACITSRPHLPLPYVACINAARDLR